MDFSQLPDPITVAGVGVTLIALYLILWWLVTRPGRGMFPVVHHRPPVAHTLASGRTAVVAVGTFGVNLVAQMALNFRVKANCQDQIGGILVVEFDRARRDEVANKGNLQGYRVECADAPLATNGFGGESIEVVNKSENRVKWVFDLNKGITGFCKLLSRPAIEPTVILIYASTGGHLLLAIEAAKSLHSHFSRADIYALTILADETDQRKELAIALDRHRTEPIFRCWLVADNRLGMVKNDQILTTFLASIWQACRVVPNTQDPYNILRDLYKPTSGDIGGGVLVLSGWKHSDLAVYPTPLPPIDFFIKRDDAVIAVLDGILAVEDPRYKCINLAAPVPNAQRYVVVNIALRQPYLSELQSEIVQRLTEIDYFTKDPNRRLIFSSLGEPLNRSSTFIPVTVTLIQASSAGVQGLIDLARSEETAQTQAAQLQAA